MGVVDSGIRARWAAVSASNAATPRRRVPAPPPAVRVPDWLGPRGTGGHRATAAERRAAYAMFTANRSAMAGLAGRPGVFASMREPDSMSPLCQRIFGVRG